MMQKKYIIPIVIVVVIIILFVLWRIQINNDINNMFNHNDHFIGKQAIEDLQNTPEHDITEITENELKQLDDYDKIIIALLYKSHEGDESYNDLSLTNNEHESFTYFHPVNNRYWPKYFYSYPYQYKQGEPWPPGMFSRLYQWSPGFYTSGWQTLLRPGITQTVLPRSQWVKNNNHYFFINNDSAGGYYKTN
jgi:hypothetical protein